MEKKIKYPRMLIIYGPTAVGKTDLALALAQAIPAEIINMDVGQFYTPLSIGTAKPDWRNHPVPHHLFDIIDKPTHWSISQYRKHAYTIAHDIIKRGKMPIFVGGSGFYLHALLYKQPHSVDHYDIAHLYSSDTNWWYELNRIDPIRASNIHPADTYRLQRALSIWHSTGKLPSSYEASYNPEMDYHLIWLNRERDHLYHRINERVCHMLNEGWIQESEKLINTEWYPFLKKKNLIGYAEIFDYILNGRKKEAFSHMVETISTHTRHYAKRQSTFWRKLEREIKKEKQYTSNSIGCLEVIDLKSNNNNIISDALVSRLCNKKEQSLQNFGKKEVI
jgi:tRNA dimethylallyltransferase